MNFDVRRLAAVDMHGVRGRRWRAWVILTEFLLGVALCLTLGVFLLVTPGDDGVGWRLFGLYLIGVSANYAVLSRHALSLRHSDALAAELAGADIPAELRYYTAAQAWVFVPLALVVFAVIRPRRSP